MIYRETMSRYRSTRFMDETIFSRVKVRYHADRRCGTCYVFAFQSRNGFQLVTNNSRKTDRKGIVRTSSLGVGHISRAGSDLSQTGPHEARFLADWTTLVADSRAGFLGLLNRYVSPYPLPFLFSFFGHDASSTSRVTVPWYIS